MDFQKFDTRAAMEAGAFCHLVHFRTREPLYTEDGEAVGCMVRAHLSAEAQKKLKKVPEIKVKTDADFHEMSTKTAMCYIIEGVQMTWGSDLIGSNMALLREFLDVSKPEMRAPEEDEMDEDDDGSSRLLNLPFAVQIIRFAKRQDHYLGE